METEETLRFSASTFFARSHPGEMCGSNGLPLTPSSITILGRAQRLLTLQHQHLCTYLDIVRGKHERIIVVSEHIGVALNELCRKLSHAEVSCIAYQLASAVTYLHDNEITHRTLAPDNILLDSNNHVKLFNYGMYHMTGMGKYVSFPLGMPKYLSPETILKGGGPSSDVWSLGIILLELCLGPLWHNLKPGPVLRRVLTLVHTANPAERIAREHDSLHAYQSIPESLRHAIESCLKILPGERATPAELAAALSEQAQPPTPPARGSGLMGCSLRFLYHWWQLAGGDIHAELKKQGLIKNSPPVLSMPIAVLLDGCTLGGRQPALTDRRVAEYSLELLRARLGHVPPEHYLPLAEEPPSPPPCDAVALPRTIRERDTEYQLHRLILFERLLHGYPYTRELIRREARTDVPPLVRGEVWAALLGVASDIDVQYERIDKETPTPTDRQIDVDVPRCHQYCWLLSGAAGHRALKRLLKAWLLTNPHYVYWQGLDSLTAPFLYLNFNHEARAFACLSAFVPHFLHKFFLRDNSAVIKEYLAKFWQTTAFHEPRLASHLHDIGFVPELFAIPWFLTMFSHVFPLHKIVHLWDALLVEGDALPLFMGVAILRQQRDTLLASGFNECILLFSDLPEIDIGVCVKESLEMCRSSPQSISYRRHKKQTGPYDVMDDVEVPMDVLFTELCPRISCNDLIKLLKEDACRVIDIRSNLLFEKCRVSGSVNVPYTGVQLGVRELRALGAAHAQLAAAAAQRRVVVVLAEGDETAQLFSDHLVKCGLPRVCILHGGVNAVHRLLPDLFTAPHGA